jgi:hypothetical protein
VWFAATISPDNGVAFIAAYRELTKARCVSASGRGRSAAASHPGARSRSSLATALTPPGRSTSSSLRTSRPHAAPRAALWAGCWARLQRRRCRRRRRSWPPRWPPRPTPRRSSPASRRSSRPCCPPTGARPSCPCSHGPVRTGEHGTTHSGAPRLGQGLAPHRRFPYGRAPRPPLTPHTSSTPHTSHLVHPSPPGRRCRPPPAGHWRRRSVRARRRGGWTSLRRSRRRGTA